MIAIVEKLTEQEAQDFIAKAAHRHPAIVLAARAREDDELFDVVVDDGDATSYADVIAAIVRGGVPIRFSVERMEREIAGLVRDALDDGSIAEGRVAQGTPLRKICEQLEWRVTSWLAPRAPASDGFNASIITPIERGVRMEGQCWFLPDCWEGSFCAEIALDSHDRLARFEVQFGDDASMKVAAFELDGTEERAHGYIVSMRGRERRFVCSISKSSE